jgi:hypothetical protein
MVALALAGCVGAATQSPAPVDQTAPVTPRHGIGAVLVGARIYVAGGGREPGFAVTVVNEAWAP